MRVLLVKPAHLTRSLVSVPQPLGILFIGSLLERLGDEVLLVDYRLGIKVDPIEKIVRDFKPDLIGFSSITVEARHLHELIARARSASSDVPIVVGGPHITAYCDEVMADPCVDFGILHEGERSTEALRKVLLEGGSLASVPGLAWRDERGEIHKNPVPEFLSSEEIDQLPSPNWNLLDAEQYYRNKNMSIVGPSRAMAVFTSRACPYRCTYCHSMFGKGFRGKSPEKVLDEFDRLVHEHGIEYIEVLDDIFNADRKRAMAIMEGSIKRNLPLKYTFPNGVRGDMFTQEMIDVFAEAGTVYICWAVETATPRLQARVKKYNRLDVLAENIRRAVDRHIVSTAFVMLGFPTETYEEAKATLKYVTDLPLHGMIINLVTPFKGTEMGDEVGDVILDHQQQGEYFGTSLNVSDMSDEQLFGLAKRGYVRFYADPRRLMRLLRDHPNRKFLLTLVRILFERLAVRNQMTDEDDEDLIREQAKSRFVESVRSPSKGLVQGAQLMYQLPPERAASA